MLDAGEPLVSRSVSDDRAPLGAGQQSVAAPNPTAFGQAVTYRAAADDWADHVYLQDLLSRAQRQPVPGVAPLNGAEPDVWSSHYWQAAALIAVVALVAWTIAG